MHSSASALATVSRAPRMDPLVSTHSRMGPRSAVGRTCAHTAIWGAHASVAQRLQPSSTHPPHAPKARTSLLSGLMRVGNSPHPSRSYVCRPFSARRAKKSSLAARTVRPRAISAASAGSRRPMSPLRVSPRVSCASSTVRSRPAQRSEWSARRRKRASSTRGVAQAGEPGCLPPCLWRAPSRPLTGPRAHVQVLHRRPAQRTPAPAPAQAAHEVPQLLDVLQLAAQRVQRRPPGALPDVRLQSCAH